MPDYKVKENWDGSYSVREEPSAIEGAAGAAVVIWFFWPVIKLALYICIMPFICLIGPLLPILVKKNLPRFATFYIWICVISGALIWLYFIILGLFTIISYQQAFDFLQQNSIFEKTQEQRSVTETISSILMYRILGGFFSFCGIITLIYKLKHR